MDGLAGADGLERGGWVVCGPEGLRLWRSAAFGGGQKGMGFATHVAADVVDGH